MKKIIFFISMIFFYVASTYAQSEDWRGGYEELLDEQEGVTTKGKSFWKTKDCEDFNLVQAGYRSDTGANGFFVGYKHGWNITAQLPLYIEPGLEFNYSTNRYLTVVGLTAPFDFSYKFKIGEFSISPITGPTLGWIHEMFDWSTRTYDDFVFGWDFGGRVAYKNFTLSYRYNKGISGDYWNTHQLAVGYIF